MEIIPSPNPSVYTDGFIPSVYTDGICPLVYTDGFADGVYSSSGNMQRHGDVRRFYRRALPRDSNWDSRTVTWRFHRRHHRRNHRRNTSVNDAVGKNDYIPCRHSLPLFLLLLSHLTSPLPNCSQTPIPNSPLFSTRALKFLISCTWSQYPFFVDFIIFCK